MCHNYIDLQPNKVSGLGELHSANQRVGYNLFIVDTPGHVLNLAS